MYKMILIPTRVSTGGKLYCKVKAAQSQQLFNVRLSDIEVLQYLGSKPKSLWAEAKETGEYDTMLDWADETKSAIHLSGVRVEPLFRFKRDANDNPVIGDDGLPVLIPQEVINPETGAVTGQWHTIVATE
jgi:hypothetical protein|tara:strand:- start:1380 stop:1769 length:390 start_codon:yes stop_codon:yes gene_type:complete